MKPVQAPVVVPSSNTSRIAGVTQVHAGTVVELYRALVAGGRWWMVPMVAVLGLAAVLLAAVTAIEYVAPFVYTIF